MWLSYRCQESRKSGMPRTKVVLFFLFIGNYSYIVLFGACTRSGDYGSHRHEICRYAMVLIPHVPDIFICHGLYRYNLTAIDNRTATDSQDKIYVVITYNPSAFLHLRISGIRHDTTKIDNFFPLSMSHLYILS